MLEIKLTTRFKKDLKKLEKQGKSMSKLGQITDGLLEGKKLAEKHRDHSLSCNYVDHRECHIEPDWLLIYKLGDRLLTLIRSGSHSELFNR